VSVRLAETEKEREAIYRLRYQAYLNEGAIAPSFSRRLTDRYDDLPNAWIVGVHHEGALVGSIRLHVTTTVGKELPALMVFSEQLQPHIDAGRVIIDPTRFVIDRDAGRVNRYLPYVLVRVAWMASEHFGADMLLATVRGEHQAFYRRLLGHQVIVEPVPYPMLAKPISLMSLDYQTAKERVLCQYPFFASTPAERAGLFNRNVLSRQAA
jgi:N-acyl-L-homoserine lactone synthetase